jgi:hypothetical protein
MLTFVGFNATESTAFVVTLPFPKYHSGLSVPRDILRLISLFSFGFFKLYGRPFVPRNRARFMAASLRLEP